MQLQMKQKKWIKKRNLCLTQSDSHACLIDTYNENIIELKKMLPKVVNAALPLQNSQVFSTQQIEYSVWSSRNEDSSFQWPWQDVKRHYFRKKAVLINSATGETWGLEYTGSKQTSDGYRWVKIPLENEHNILIK